MAEGDITIGLDLFAPTSIEPRYATALDLELYVQGTSYETQIPTTQAASERAIALAEPDVDHACGNVWMPNQAGDRLWFPLSDLSAADVAGLRRATCAQVLYRLEMGDEHFVRAQRERVTGRAFSAEGKLPIVGPQTWRELRSTTLVRRSTQTGGRRGRPARAHGWGDDPDFW